MDEHSLAILNLSDVEESMIGSMIGNVKRGTRHEKESDFELERRVVLIAMIARRTLHQMRLNRGDVGLRILRRWQTEHTNQ